MLSFLLCSIIFVSFLNLSFISLLLWPYLNTTDDSVFFFCLLTVLLIVLDVRAGNFYFIFLLIVRAGNF